MLGNKHERNDTRVHIEISFRIYGCSQKTKISYICIWIRNNIYINIHSLEKTNHTSKIYHYTFWRKQTILQRYTITYSGENKPYFKDIPLHILEKQTILQRYTITYSGENKPYFKNIPLHILEKTNHTSKIYHYIFWRNKPYFKDIPLHILEKTNHTSKIYHYIFWRKQTILQRYTITYSGENKPYFKDIPLHILEKTNHTSKIYHYIFWRKQTILQRYTITYSREVNFIVGFAFVNYSWWQNLANFKISYLIMTRVIHPLSIRVKNT